MAMSNANLLLPLFVQVALTFVLMFWTARERTGSVARKETRMADIALGQPNWPARATQVANAFSNQFQLPVLFYVLVVLAIAMGQVTLPLVVLAWLFVVARLVHAYIHTGSNYVPHRFYAFAASFFVLVGMWGVFAAQVLMAA